MVHRPTLDSLALLQEVAHKGDEHPLIALVGDELLGEAVLGDKGKKYLSTRAKGLSAAGERRAARGVGVYAHEGR